MPPAPSGPPFDRFSHRLKLARAHDHLQQLQTEIGLWGEGDHYAVTTETDPDDPEYTIMYVEAEPIPRDPFALLIGDFLHNARSALDHLAFNLATVHTDPLPDDFAESSEFPIFGDKPRGGGRGQARFHELQKDGSPTRRSGLWKIRGLNPSAQTLVDGLQPYQRGGAYIDHPLWHLHELSRLDKHRVLHLTPIALQVVMDIPGRHIVFDVSGSINLDPGVPVPGGNAILSGTVEVGMGGEFEGRTQVVRYRARPVDPAREMNVNFGAFLIPSFPAVYPVVPGAGIIETLTGIYEVIGSDAFRDLEPFLVTT